MTARNLSTRPWVDAIARAREELVDVWRHLDLIERATHARVLRAFQAARVRSFDLQAGTAGYGYDDGARKKTEEVFARAFQAEAAIVRPQLASGTHAIWVCLDALLRPGDHLISATGPPYDTLRHTICGNTPGSLVAKGVAYDELPLKKDGRVDLALLEKALRPESKLILLQRSKGYTWRPALSIEAIAEVASWRRKVAPQLTLMVDNCYGEFVETEEPCGVGADLAVGSLIKNPGGTIAPAGGYVVGVRPLIERIGERVTAPGLGLALGPTLGTARYVLQGLFLAPHLVKEAHAGLLLASHVLEHEGYDVLPRWHQPGGDAVLAVRLGTAQRLLAFCRAVQAASPIDCDAVPEPGPLPGYEIPVVMAAGTFIQGGSSEFTADGPMREPFAAFMQGGVSRVQLETALPHVLEALKNVAESP